MANKDIRKLKRSYKNRLVILGNKTFIKTGEHAKEYNIITLNICNFMSATIKKPNAVETGNYAVVMNIIEALMMNMKLFASQVKADDKEFNKTVHENIMATMKETLNILYSNYYNPISIADFQKAVREQNSKANKALELATESLNNE